MDSKPPIGPKQHDTSTAFTGFPDLTLPEKDGRETSPNVMLTQDTAGPATAPGSAHVSPTPWSANWKVGDMVLAPWEPVFLYVGTISQLDGKQALIEFLDGDSGWVFTEQIRRLALEPAQKVLSRRRMGPTHFPAEISEVRGDRVCVFFEDTKQEEWTSLGAVRIPCQAIGPAATQTRAASHLAFYKNLRSGERVWAPWNSGVLFVGTVAQLQGNNAQVQFDDGDSGWVLIEQLLPLEIPPGLPLMVRSKDGTKYLPGVVAAVEGDRVLVHYDAGNKEWTTTAALAVPCQPYGPDARPTRTATHTSTPMNFRWLGSLGLIVLFVLLRAGCR